MSVRQETREERAEAAARKAADELAAIRSERGRQREAEDEREESLRLHKDYGLQGGEERRGGVLESIKEGTKSLFGVITGRTQEAAEKTAEKAGETKDATVQKARAVKDSASQKAGETKDETVETARETKDSAAEKAREMKDKTMGKAGGYKDYVADKAKEAKDATAEKTRKYKESAEVREREAKDTAAEKAREHKGSAEEKARQAAEKTRETKDMVAEKTKGTTESAKQKMEEYKDAAADAARKARDYLAGTGEVTKERLAEAEEKAEQKMEEAKRKEEQSRREEESRQWTEEYVIVLHGEIGLFRSHLRLTDFLNVQGQRGGGGGLFGAIGSMAESIKEKLSVSKDETEPKEEERLTVVCATVRDAEGGDDDVPLRVKEADQSSGQGFNDVGKMGEEGTGPPSLRLSRHGDK
ncbi:LOW QUALITY PROTEIN: embryonic protein DC-8-like [Musa acuminata AAA Group]|uniref:LOW QUALITY PROTEIN: embryonic protein DC-8-like n=1 Tax=Musa acuminata AAA Group TaxID=214697 RepID=UPI0031D3579A